MTSSNARLALAALPCASLLVLAACGTTALDVARARAVHDFHCSEDEISVSEVAGTSYEAKGCGDSAVYNCARSDVSRGRNNYLCVREGDHDKSTDE